MNNLDWIESKTVSKHEQLVRKIAERILAGSISEASVLPPENRAASEAGVSRVTVRRAYEILEELGVVEKVHGRGTYVRPDAARILRGIMESSGMVVPETDAARSSGIIGVMLPELQNFFPKVLTGIESAAHERGYSISLGLNPTVEKETACIERFLKSGVDGLIVNPLRYAGNHSKENYLRIQQSGLPFVMIGKPPISIHCDAVYCDDVIGSCNTVRTMFSKGCGIVIHISNSNCDEESVEERSYGYRMGCELSGRPNDALTLDFSREDFPELLHRIVTESSERVGLFLYDDLMAPIVIDLILRAGRRIPEDVAVVGYNDLDLCENLPVRLSSVRIPQSTMGALSIRQLIDKIGRKNAEGQSGAVHHEILMTEMFERDSL